MHKARLQQGISGLCLGLCLLLGVTLMSLSGCSINGGDGGDGTISGGDTGSGRPGGGGTSNPPGGTQPPPAPPIPPAIGPGAVTGRLIVPPSNVVEIEPNDALNQAQVVRSTSTVSGQIAFGDAGFRLPGLPDAQVEDLYRIDATDRVQITLTIAADDLSANDIDLLLLDSTGALLDVSQGFVATEVLETPAAGTFFIGVRAFQGASAYTLSLAALGSIAGAQEESLPPPGAAFVPGEILVKFRADVVEKVAAQQRLSTLAAAHDMTHMASLPPDVEMFQVVPAPRAFPKSFGSQKLDLPGSDANAMKALTLDSVRRLRRDPQVAYAEPNLLRQPSRLPNDPLSTLQWDYQLMNLPTAWDTTTGSDEVIVAVLDTGVLGRHPDLASRLIAGFDFVSDPQNANDGDGLDADPTDVGDDIQHSSSSFHGTHVAGTIGAVTNNSQGVAGVTWQTRLMPLRVLGVRGGTDADIAQAIRYAAGLPNTSNTLPPRRAHIINMSLGGPGRSQTLQDAVTAARAQGVILVAAAGNENTSLPQSPAALNGVISVAAVDLASQKAPYSNFGPTVDVAAPGGNLGADLNGDGQPDGILSTLGRDDGTFTYRFYQGTSMAAPHVAGVLALMLAVNPNLTPDDIDQLLAGSHPGTAQRITRDLGALGRDDTYGHGLLDAAAAVAAARAIPGGQGNTPTGSLLTTSTQGLDFANFLNTLTFEISNAGAGTLTILGVTDNVSWLTLTPTSGTAPLRVTATVNRTGLASGTYTGVIAVRTNASQGAASTTVAVTLQVGGSTSGDLGRVFVLVVDPETFDTVAEGATSAAQNYVFTISEIPPGTYAIVAGTDRDDDALLCDIEDACGFFPSLVTIAPGQTLRDLEFVVGEVLAPQQSGEQQPQTFHGPWRRRR